MSAEKANHERTDDNQNVTEEHKEVRDADPVFDTTIRDTEKNTDYNSIYLESEKAVSSTISSLKEIVTIITGLTITNAITRLLVTNQDEGIVSLSQLTTEAVLFFILLTANVIRFYHGNMRHLDTAYLSDFRAGSVQVSRDLKVGSRRIMGLDFFVILVQSIIFSVMSFLLGDPTTFVIVFTSLLVFDVIWVLSIYQFASSHEAFVHQRNWALNNVVAVIALFVILLLKVGGQTEFFVLVASFTIAINTIVDFVISWRFYFPTLPYKKDELGNEQARNSQAGETKT
jgi:hypothetical protein